MTETDAKRCPDAVREEQRKRTCCLTGHRDIPPGEEEQVMARVRDILRELIEKENVCYFGVGGAVGFDMLAAEYLLDLKRQSEPRLKIISVLPWPGWRKTPDWTEELRVREQRILDACDKVVYVREHYEKKVFLIRDRALVDHSAHCVSYCSRLRTGTAYTVRYAMENGVRVWNAGSLDPADLLRPRKGTMKEAPEDFFYMDYAGEAPEANGGGTGHEPA